MFQATNKLHLTRENVDVAKKMENLQENINLF